jgi:hypothetical protein
LSRVCNCDPSLSNVQTLLLARRKVGAPFLHSGQAGDPIEHCRCTVFNENEVCDQLAHYLNGIDGGKSDTGPSGVDKQAS